MPELREHIVEVMGLEGIQASAEDVVVATGSQNALELVSKLFLDPGDLVLAEGPSYVDGAGSVPLVRSRGATSAHGRTRPDPGGAAGVHRPR